MIFMLALGFLAFVVAGLSGVGWAMLAVAAVYAVIIAVFGFAAALERHNRPRRRSS